eukprot:gene9985-18925_t
MAALFSVLLATTTNLMARQPRPDTFPIDPATPARLAAHKDVQALISGYVDPTKPPYSAAGDGVTDDAAALQAAIDDAYAAKMSVVLPAGRTFLCSTQLRFIQPPNVTDHWVQMPFNGTYHAGGQGNCDPKTTQDCTPSVFMLFQYLDT